MLPYPFSYFSTLLHPKKMFANRQALSLWQRLFTTLFLIALLAIPASIQILKLGTYPLELFLNGVDSPLTEQVITDLADHSSIVDGQFTYTGEQSYHNISFGDTIPEETGFTYQFSKEKLIIRKDHTIVVDISYQGFDSSSFTSKTALMTKISQVWFQQNRLVISITILSLSIFLLGFNLLFIAFGATFFLYLTKKSRLFQLHSFKECYNLVLYCLGLPSIIACLTGLMGQPVTTVILVQNILFVLVLLWVFFSTKFQDLP